MDEPTPLPEKPSASPETPGGGIDIHGGDVRAGRDVVAGDVNVAGDSISGQTVSVQRGFSANEVQRLILIVGGLVFVTAACFFVVGAVAAATLVGALNRPVESSEDAAVRMQQKIDALNSLSPGQEFRVNFSEDELSSYFRFVLGPAIGVSEGKARLLDDPGQIALSGNADNFGGLPFIAQLEVTTGAIPFQLKGAWLKLIPSPEGSSFGYVPVTFLAQNLNERINALLFGRVQFTGIAQSGGGSDRPPENGNRLFLTGKAK